MSANRNADALGAVEALHVSDGDAANPYCRHCVYRWPCPTVKVITGVTDHTAKATR